MSGCHYHTRVARILLYPFGTVTIFLGLIVTFVPRGALLLHIWAAAWTIGAAWLLRRSARLGIDIVEDGIVAYGAFWSKHVPWDEIAGFDTQRWVINQEVGVKLANGERVRTSLLQGRVVAWHGGKTRDILSILQTELDSHASEGDEENTNPETSTTSI